MPDISMCVNLKCEKRQNCYRYLAYPCEYQSYAKFNENGCNFFMPILNGEHIRDFNEVDKNNKKIQYWKNHRIK